jgi:hypothetical protein
VTNPVFTTVTSSTTVTNTVTSVQSTTFTQTSFETVTTTSQANQVNQPPYYGNPNYQCQYPNQYQCYPNYQCQYPNQYQCYGQGQTQQIYGYLAPSQVAGSCIYLTNTNTGFTYALYNQYGNMLTNFPTGYITAYGTIPYNQSNYPCTGIPLLVTNF